MCIYSYGLSLDIIRWTPLPCGYVIPESIIHGVWIHQKVFFCISVQNLSTILSLSEKEWKYLFLRLSIGLAFASHLRLPSFLLKRSLLPL